MAYFSNQTENDIYVANICARCVHHDKTGEGMCPVMWAHMLLNYEECNDPESILHLLVPRSEDGTNEECRMFYMRPTDRCLNTPDMFGDE